MRVGLLTEGGYPYANGAASTWCDRLVRGLGQHEFEVCALSRSAEQEAAGWVPLPDQVRRVRTAPLWGDLPYESMHGAARPYRRRERARFAEHFGHFARAISAATIGSPDDETDTDQAGAASTGETARDGDAQAPAARGTDTTKGCSGAAAMAGIHSSVPAGTGAAPAAQEAESAGDMRRGAPAGNLGWSAGLSSGRGGVGPSRERSARLADRFATVGQNAPRGPNCPDGRDLAASGGEGAVTHEGVGTVGGTGTSTEAGRGSDRGAGEGSGADEGLDEGADGSRGFNPLRTSVARASGAYAVPSRTFTDGLYGLAELARNYGGLSTALRSEQALRLLEAACHAPGAMGDVQRATVTELLAVTRYLESALRPLSLDWYGDGDGGRAGARPHNGATGCIDRPGLPDHGDACGEAAERGLAGVDLCHATSGGPAALPGLLAKRFFGTPLLVTEHGTRLREHYLAHSGASATNPACPPERAPHSAPVRALIASFHRQLAAEVYAQAALITPGHAHTRRWQERCGADPARVRTVYPGLDVSRFADAGEGGAAGADDGRTLLWVGRVEPSRDLLSLLHAFAQVHRAEPGSRLRIVDTGPPAGPDETAAGTYPIDAAALLGSAPPMAMAYGAAAYGAAAHGATAFGPAAGGTTLAAVAPGATVDTAAVWGGMVRGGMVREGRKGAARWGRGGGGRWRTGAGRFVGGGTVVAGGDGTEAGAAAYRAHCAAVAAQLFPDEAAHAHAVGDNPVSFEVLGDLEVPNLQEAYAGSSVVVRSSVAEGFPVGLVEAMFCGRATVSTDVGAVGEVVGGTGVMVPPRNPRALAAACLTLLRDPERRERLGAAARARALELFTVEQNVTAYRGSYLELMAHAPVRRVAGGGSAEGSPLPFTHPAEAQVPGRWTAADAPARLPHRATPSAAPGRPAPRWAARPGAPASHSAGSPALDGAAERAAPTEAGEAACGRSRKREEDDA
ncbi:DUF3492 domain-containing protein [Streptomyces zagrosensis]|uniref:DUF3492 domain-containing protein n=1 Tax=Streptomyces zagrosensis TaxID=1042984 RepID=UPI0028AAEF5E|nr:DUF3492 domain-containing protein [Streptomyces zagrosensis]